MSSFPSADMARCWAGALTDTSFSVVADVEQTCYAARIKVSVNSDLSSPVYTSGYVQPVVTTGAQLTYKTLYFTVTGLSQNTKYYYGFDFQYAPAFTGVSRSLTTAPAAGSPAAFKFVVGSCSQLDPAIASADAGHRMLKSNIHQAIALDTPLFFFHIDDIDYSDISSTSAATQRDRNARFYCSSPDVDILNRTCPIMYLPGDHDLGPNDSTLDTTNAETIFRNARQVYRETVPYYPFVQTTLGETNLDHVTLTQTATFGKIRFLLLDCMSQSRLNITALGQALGNGDYWDQRSWLTTALAQAATDGMEWTFVCLPRGWIDFNQTCFNDVFTAERTAICDIIEASDARVCLLWGDSHLVAFDDGGVTGSFATDGFARFPGITASGLFITGPSSGSTSSWNGSAGYHYISSTKIQDGYYVLFDVAADNKSWTATCKGTPINDGTKVPTTVASVNSADVTPAVSFNNAAPSVAHGVPLTVNLDKTWFGTCSVHWAASDGQSGNVSFKPNKKRASFSVTFAAAGSPTITLSSPSGCTISGTNPATVTVS